MAEIDASQKKSAWEHAFGWASIGAISIFLLGAGVSVMTTSHPYIADTFFAAGFLLFLVKFWAWDGAKHDTMRKTGALLAGVTIAILLLFAGSCWLSSYLNTPKQRASEPASNAPQTAKNVPLEKPNEAPENVPPPLATSRQKHVHAQALQKPSPVPGSDSQATPVYPQAPPQSTYQQQCVVGSACAQGPDSQATVNQYGAIKLHMSDEQVEAVASAMESFRGSNITITCIYEDDSLSYCTKLSEALQGAGIKVDGPHTVVIEGAHPYIDGVSFFRAEDRAHDADALGKALIKARLISKPVPTGTVPEPGTFEVIVRPNR